MIGNGKATKTESVATRIEKPAASSSPRSSWTAAINFITVGIALIVLGIMLGYVLPEIRSAAASLQSAKSEAEALRRAIEADRANADERIKQAEDARRRAITQEATLLLRQAENLKVAREIATALKKGSGDGN